LVVGDLGALELAPGDYWIEKLTLGPGARLLPSGEGTVRLHLLNDFTLPWQAMINATGFGQPSNPAHILVLARGAVTLDASSTLAGFVYSRGDLIQGYGAQVYGGAVASNVQLNTLATVSFNSAALAALDSG